MTEKPLVSVIINCYNGEKYLREAIDSVMAQTYENWELVFWDNQSTDSTREIVESYHSDKIHYYYASSHTPLGEARNRALIKASGEYVAFLDADDLWLPDFLTDCIRVLNSNREIGFVFTRFFNFDGLRVWLSPGKKKNCRISIHELCGNYNVGMSAAVVRAHLVVKNGVNFDTRFSLIEDYDFFIHLVSFSDAFYISKPLMKYRWHDGNLTKSDGWLNEFELFYDKTKSTPSLSAIEDIVKKYCDYIEVRSFLQKNKRKQAFNLIIHRIWKNPLLIKYFYPIIFGMDSFHRLRTKIS